MWCWSEGRGILTELSLCCSTAYHYNGTYTMVQTVLTSQSTGSGFDLAWFSFLYSKRLCIFGLGSALCYTSIYIYIFLVIFTTLPFSKHNGLTWLTITHCPSVLLHCWLGHLTRKSSPKWPIMCQVFIYFSYCIYRLHSMTPKNTRVDSVIE